ncbi:hypothetical protein Tco_0874650 [Tanacetum coccineum]|uniref:Reverse transcriptase Ty1/copia-type domain-containing protein n=1 Tax=Tanacetum coccineum TaxID=301880 RepID=A0ABQ5BRF4_9ASTR
METIHVKFDELTAIDSEQSCLEPETKRFNFEDSLAESNQTPSKEDLNDLFGPMYEKYFKKRSPEVSTNFVAPKTLNNEDTPSSSSIIVEGNKAPPFVSSSKEQTSPILNDVADESIQEDSADRDGNTLITQFCPPVTEEAESSSTNQDPSNMHEFNQLQYTLELLKKYGMDGYDSITTPMATVKLDADLHGTPSDQTKYHSMIGGLMYLTASRPDIAFTTFTMHGAMTTTKAHQEACNFWEKNWLGGPLKSKIVQRCRPQKLNMCLYPLDVLKSIRTQLLDYGYRFNKIPMYCNSKSAIAISGNPVQPSCTKRINILYHFIKEHVERGTVELYFVRTEYQLTDLFTIALPKKRFEF